MVFTNSGHATEQAQHTATKQSREAYKLGSKSKHLSGGHRKESSSSASNGISDRRQDRHKESMQKADVQDTSDSKNKPRYEKRGTSGYSHERNDSHRKSVPRSGSDNFSDPAENSSLNLMELQESIGNLDKANTHKPDHPSKAEKYEGRSNKSNRYSAKRESRQIEASNKRNHNPKPDKSEESKSQSRADRAASSSKDLGSSSGRRKKDFSQDSRLFDPYAKPEPRKVC